MTSNEMNFNDPFSIEEIYQFMMDKMLTEGVLFSPKRARRLLHNGHRHYYWVEEREGQPWVSDFYPSVTTITQHGKHTDIGLLKYYASKTWEETLRDLWFARSYGSFLHIVQAELSGKMMEYGNNLIDLDVLTLRKAMTEYARALDLPHSWIEKNWLRVCKNLMSWRVFCREYCVQFLLIEKTVFNVEDRYSGTMDYLMRILDGPRHKAARKGSHRRYELKKPDEAEWFTSLLDVKSGKAMYDDGVQQLHLLKRAAELNFPIKVQKVLHYNPTDWRTSPGFNLIDATDHPEAGIIDTTLEMAHHRLGKIDDEPYRKTVSGWLMGDDHAWGFEIDSLTVREAVAKYEAGQGLELGLPTDQELAAEHGLAQYLRNTITNTKQAS